MAIVGPASGGTVTVASVGALFTAAGQVIQGTGAGTGALVFPAGQEVAGTYAQFTAQASVVTTSEATATALVTAGTFTFDGATSIYVEFCAGYYQPPNTLGGTITTCLYDKVGAAAAASIGLAITGQNDVAATSTPIPAGVWRTSKFIPTAAAHIYSMRAFVSTGTGFVTVGLGGVGAFFPGYIRCVYA